MKSCIHQKTITGFCQVCAAITKKHEFSELAKSLGVGKIKFDIKPSWMFVDCSCGKTFKRNLYRTTWCACGYLIVQRSVQDIIGVKETIALQALTPPTEQRIVSKKYQIIIDVEFDSEEEAEYIHDLFESFEREVDIEGARWGAHTRSELIENSIKN